MISYEFRAELAAKRDSLTALFDFHDKIGQGTYGHVYRARPRAEARVRFPEPYYALKSIYRSTISLSMVREISLLRECSHRNVVALQRVFTTETNQIWMLLEYAEYDLHSIVYHMRTVNVTRNKRSITERMARAMLYQLLKGLEYLHAINIVHRDIKPGNLLIKGDGPQRGVLKIADFGISRIIDKDVYPPLTHLDKVVVTYWYRSPELVLGSANYGPCIDIWAAACCYMEVLLLWPFFHTPPPDEQHLNSTAQAYYRDHLLKIVSMIGEPSAADETVLSQLPYHARFKADFDRGHPYCYRLVDSLLHCGLNMPPEVVDLLNAMFAYNPRTRISAKNARMHDYFMIYGHPVDDILSEMSTVTFPPRALINQEPTRTKSKEQRIEPWPAAMKVRAKRKMTSSPEVEFVMCKKRTEDPGPSTSRP